MKKLFSFILILFSASISLGVHAGEVYKTVDENGNVVFSDKKTQDAETIDVQPNVVGLDIPDMPESAAQERSNSSISNSSGSNSSGSTQQEMGGWNANNGSNLRRRVRTETNGEGVNRNRPSATPAGRPGGR